MNKRQAKKNFKKKYGVNPDEYEKMMANALKDALKNLPDIIDEVTMQLRIGLETMIQLANDAAVQLANNMQQWAKRAEEFNSWMEILKNSHPLPYGTDLSLLECLGTRIDPEGYKYKLYKDTANGVYFVDYLEDKDE